MQKLRNNDRNKIESLNWNKGKKERKNKRKTEITGCKYKREKEKVQLNLT